MTDTTKLSTAECYGIALCELGEEHKDVVALTADLAKSTKIGMFGEKFPDRFFNVGIAEQNLFGVAAGMAKNGLIPFASTFAIFASARSLDQVHTDICYQNVPVKIIATHAGTSFGQAGSTHHSLIDMACMRVLPNMTVICPCDGSETYHAVKAAYDIPGPVYIRINRGFDQVIYKSPNDCKFEWNKATLMNDGTVIRPKVEAVKDKLSFTFVDLETIAKETSAADIIAKPRFKALFKLFSPIHLQKLPFAEDHNTLNRKFYTELLYIMGLEERGEKHQIQRLEAKKRQAYSVFEQAYALLADYDITTDKVTGREIDARFETALGLVIVWINRTLFMKLLESQLIAFNGSKRKYAFFDKLTDFALMHNLFCKVMAIPEAERSDEMRAKFGEVPYLNSSLFELTDIEQKYFPISSLRDSEVAVMKNTCLKDNKGKTLTGRIHILDYLKRFLDSYDFGADTGESGKTIINASVLGLIFEKINGYKDGSFFTPGYITSYLCRETLRRCVTDKYNQTYATQYASFDELAEDFDPTDKTRRDEVNSLINNIRICDPAVGSGHFIVSALNELIAIKWELKVLKTIDGKRFKYRVDVEDDELVVTDADGELRYNPNDSESQLVQETLFEEKRTIIENCLFGVDINPNSAEICQLRLWIELLKNAYYIKGNDGKRHLQTLPNIDINIKCGNSLVMKYPLDAPIDHVLRGANVTIGDYKNHVAHYKNSPSKENKHIVEHDIWMIKSKLNEGYDKDTDKYKKWVKVCSDILLLDNSLFPPEEAESKRLSDLRKQEEKLRVSLEEASTRYAHLGAFEWRYEFPETLNEKGEFIGFDCIIGNPPYGVSIKDGYRKTVEERYEHMPDYEIY